ncbi:hypothetical protein BDZ97DRAFT_858345 [Flammula alnicola]|nr:hypothetical protein BDZ97DRAFT_858345 [Flammula alnicola]
MQGSGSKTHPLFDASDADVMIQSSDGVIFRIHQKNLETHTGVFPPAEFDTQEVVYLSEPASVLEILFHFIYPKRYPGLEDQNFEVVAAVAEAVEKYEVFSAMKTCEVRLREFLPEHADQILSHALKHDYPTLIDEAAPHLARSALVSVLEKLPFNGILPWVRYQKAWDAIFEQAMHTINVKAINSCCTGIHLCERCRLSLLIWVTKLKSIGTVSTLKQELENPNARTPVVFDVLCGNQCRDCRCQHLPSVVDGIRSGIENIPAFSTFVRPHPTPV